MSPNTKMTLGNIKSAKVSRPPRILVLGVEKIGKSTFACGADSPIVIPVKGEEGVDDFDVPSFPVADHVLDIKQALITLDQEEHDFKTLVVDSVSTLQPKVMAFAMQKEGVSDESKLGGGYGHQYDTALRTWDSILTGMDMLREKGVASILIGHVASKNFECPINGTYSRYDLDLPNKIREKIYRWVDCILFANYQTFIRKEDAGFNRTKSLAAGDGGRRLFTQKRPSHPGGGRGVFGKIPYEIDLSWAAFKSAIVDASKPTE